jgi:hypothetical protein
MLNRLLILILLQMLPLTASASVRVAVISDADDRDLAALITTELSTDPEISLIERDDLAKIGDELKLQQLAGSDAVALGKLIGADGLVFIGKSPAGLQVRFTAVSLGYALFDNQVPSGLDLVQEAKSIAHLVEGYAPKLKLSPSQAVPISVLNLRADYATADSTALERKLTLLLESRLASLPEYVVLERRHAWSLQFERSLDPATKPLLQGAYLIDGTLSLPMKDTGDFTAHLRLRTPSGKQVDTAIPGSANDLAALVEKMMIEIKKATGNTSAPVVRQTESEAQEYLTEGFWGCQHHANEAALEALDSAELLGANIADVEAIRTTVLGQSIDEGMELWEPRMVGDTPPPSLDAAELSRRTDLALRAIPEVARYRDEKQESRLRIKWLYGTQAIVGMNTYAISKLLFLLEQANSPRADELRLSLRAITGYDPLHGQMGERIGGGINGRNMGDVFADDWAQNLGEELAYYRLVCAADQYYYPPPLQYATDLGRVDRAFCARFAPDPAHQQKIFDQFVESLKDLPNARLSYLLLQANSPDQVVADAAFKAYLDDLWEKRDELVAPEWRSEWCNAGYAPKAVVDRNYKATLPLLHYDLTHAKTFGFNKHAFDFLWRPDDWSEEEAAAVWKDYAAYKERTARDWAARHPDDAPDFSDQEAPFFKKFPQFATSPPKLPELPQAQPSLVITRFWYPWLSTSWPKGFMNCDIADVDDEGVWVVGDNADNNQVAALFHVHLSDFTTRMVMLPDHHEPETLVHDSDAIYMTWEAHGHDNNGKAKHQMARFDLATSTWAVHDLPDYAQGGGELYSLNNSLYLFLTSRTDDEMMARYDWNQDRMTVLSSTRRHPAQNQFDDRRIVRGGHMFTGPGHKPCVLTEEGTFYIQETPGPWPKVFDGTGEDESLTADGITLVSNQFGEATLLDPEAAAPEHWMAASNPRFRKTPWAQDTIWDPPDGNMHYTVVAFNRDHLFVLEDPKVKGGTYDLLVYEKGKGRSARHIPLEFHLDDGARASLTRSNLSHSDGDFPVTWKESQLEHPDTTIYPGSFVSFYSTKQGLCMNQDDLGFWFLPYRDIDDYLKSHGETPAPSAPQSITAAKAVPLTPSGNDADNYDPGDASSFR